MKPSPSNVFKDGSSLKAGPLFKERRNIISFCEIFFKEHGSVDLCIMHSLSTVLKTALRKPEHETRVPIP
tara:strand:+ start:1321 stop:1530 length:210 start_codon:yes stop_codon:yes gene_type:complete